MEDIQLLQQHEVEEELDCFLAVEMTALIEHEAPPWKTR